MFKEVSTVWRLKNEINAIKNEIVNERYSLLKWIGFNVGRLKQQNNDEVLEGVLQGSFGSMTKYVIKKRV